MAVIYEWDIEETMNYDDGDNDIIEHWFQESYARVKKHLATATPMNGCTFEPVLVRDDDAGRAWAYLVDGKLPTHFENANGAPVAKVPKRFVDEIERASK